MTCETRLLRAMKPGPNTVRDLATATGIASENVRSMLRVLASRGDVVCVGSVEREPGVAGSTPKLWARVVR